MALDPPTHIQFFFDVWSFFSIPNIPKGGYIFSVCSGIMTFVRRTDSETFTICETIEHFGPFITNKPPGIGIMVIILPVYIWCVHVSCSM